jgi:hypothetical protein
MIEEFKKSHEENQVKFKKINKNFDLKEIMGNNIEGTFDS